MPAPSKDRFTLSSQVTICQDADLRGEITIGSGCVFSPKCTVLAMNGPIVFGDGCIVEENVIIVNRYGAALYCKAVPWRAPRADAKSPSSLATTTSSRSAVVRPPARPLDSSDA
jgi:acetyltransferase-like isoleucine patch superfamily enzyme